MASLDSLLVNLVAAAYVTYCNNVSGVNPSYSDAVNFAIKEVDGMNDEETEEWMTNIFNDEADLIVHLDNDYNLGIALN